MAEGETVVRERWIAQRPIRVGEGVFIDKGGEIDPKMFDQSVLRRMEMCGMVLKGCSSDENDIDTENEKKLKKKKIEG